MPVRYGSINAFPTEDSLRRQRSILFVSIGTPLNLYQFKETIFYADNTKQTNPNDTPSHQFYDSHVRRKSIALVVLIKTSLTADFVELILYIEYRIAQFLANIILEKNK